MFIGHFAMGFAATRWAPRLRLGDALVGAQLPDMLWPCFVLAGVERVSIVPGDTVVTPLRFESYPISHSLIMTAVWGAALGALYYARKGSGRGAVALAFLSVSHWVLDFVSHRADMPLWLGDSPLLGLGLWNSRPATLIVELALFAAGAWLYAGSPHASGKGRLALRFLVGGLGLVYLANVFGPPPPSVTAVAVSGILIAPLGWVWANWVDREFRRVPAA